MQKNIKKGACIAVGTLMMVCFVAGTGFAFGGPHHGGGFNKDRGFCGFYGPGGDRGHHFDSFLVDQGIPAATVTAFKNDCQKFGANNQAAFDAMQAKRLELYEEMTKAAPDAAKAKALQADLNKMKADLDAKRIDHMLYLKTTYPQIGEIMHKHFADGKPFGPGHPGPGKFGPGPNR